VFGTTDKWSDAVISVLVCDDAALSRRQLTVALEESDHIEVVAEAADGDTALAEAIESTPDVVWMGLHLGGLAGVRLIASIRELVPAARFVLMCGPDDGDLRARALRTGGHGFVRREEAPASAVAITQQVAWGRAWLETRDLQVLRDTYAALDRQSQSVQQLEVPHLDDVSDPVLTALGGGETAASVGASTGIGESGVEGLVSSALERLHRHTRTDAMAFAVDEQAFGPP
jgi:two-component system response regulator DesR